MSNISTALDAVVSVTQTALSSHTRIPNPYTVQDNPEGLLRLGWGLRIGTGVNTERQLSCKLSTLTNIEVVITRKAYAKENDYNAKFNVDKLILEDEFLVKTALLKNSNLDGVYANLNYIGHDSIQTVFDGKDHTISLISQFDLEVFEDLN